MAPRDGLQNEPQALPIETRVELVHRIAAAGLPRIEAVSFVDDRRVPQMSGAEAVVEGIERTPGTSYSGLVLNEKGYDRFAQNHRLEGQLYRMSGSDEPSRSEDGSPLHDVPTRSA